MLQGTTTPSPALLRMIRRARRLRKLRTAIVGLMPERRRTGLGPTRYVARCECNNPLPIGRHTGVCTECHERFLLSLRNTVGLLSNPDEVAALEQGLADAAAERTRSLEEILG